MAKLELDKIGVEIVGIDKVKTLIELLGTNLDKLPEELAASVRECADSTVIEYNVGTITNMGFDLKSIECSIDTKKVMSANKILKRVTVITDYGSGHIYPEHFWIRCGDQTIVEW